MLSIVSWHCCAYSALCRLRVVKLAQRQQQQHLLLHVISMEHQSLFPKLPRGESYRLPQI